MGLSAHQLVEMVKLCPSFRCMSFFTPTDSWWALVHLKVNAPAMTVGEESLLPDNVGSIFIPLALSKR